MDLAISVQVSSVRHVGEHRGILVSHLARSGCEAREHRLSLPGALEARFGSLRELAAGVFLAPGPLARSARARAESSSLDSFPDSQDPLEAGRSMNEPITLDG